VKKQTFDEKVADVVFDDVCIEYTLRAMIKNYKAWAAEHKIGGFPEYVAINIFAYGVMAKSKAEATELAARGLAVPLFPDRAKYLYEARLNKVERIGK